MVRRWMETVPAAVMLRCIAVLGERGHDHIPFYPVPVFPRRRFPEPYFVVYPVCLQHIGGKRHVEVGQVAPLAQRRLMVLGVLYGHIEPLEDQKRLAFPVFVRVVERIQDKPHTHSGASLTDTLLLY